MYLNRYSYFNIDLMLNLSYCNEKTVNKAILIKKFIGIISKKVASLHK